MTYCNKPISASGIRVAAMPKSTNGTAVTKPTARVRVVVDAGTRAMSRPWVHDAITPRPTSPIGSIVNVSAASARTPSSAVTFFR